MAFYKNLTNEDRVNDTAIVTSGLFQDGASNITTFFTSSTQSSSNGQYYYDMYKTDPASDSEAEIQFSVAYGDRNGSGSLGQNEDSPSNAIYSQYAQILLPDNQRVFKFNNVASEHIYAINLNRAR